MACFLEEKISIEDHKNRAYYWDSLGLFYQMLFVKKLSLEINAEDCAIARWSVSEEGKREYLNKARDYLKLAVEDESLDIVERDDGTYDGSDVDIVNRYKAVLLLIDKLPKP